MCPSPRPLDRSCCERFEFGLRKGILESTDGVPREPRCSMNSRTREPGPKDRWPGSTADNTGLCAKDPPARLGQPFFAFSSEVPPTLPTPPGVGRGLPTHRGQGTPEKKGVR